MRRFLYYALGGGLGHAMRTLSLARKNAEFGGTHTVICNSPFSTYVQKQFDRESDRIKLICLSPQMTPSESAVKIDEIFQQVVPEVIVVDTFPRGLGGELVEILSSTELMKILVCRTLPPRYVSDMGLVEFVGRCFDAVLLPGEESQFSADLKQVFEKDKVALCDRFLIRSRHEMPSREQACAAISTVPESPTVLFVGNGNLSECQQAIDEFNRIRNGIQQSELNSEIQFRISIPSDYGADSVDPSTSGFAQWRMPENLLLFEALPAIDFVIGSAGYNLFWETSSLLIPAILRPQDRKYDSQSARLSKYGRDNLVADVTSDEQILRRLVDLKKRADDMPQFQNGAEQAAQWLAKCLG